MRPILKLLGLKLMTETELRSVRIILVKATLKIGQEKYLLSILFLKTNPWTYKIKDLNGEKIKGIFYEKEFMLSIL